MGQNTFLGYLKVSLSHKRYLDVFYLTYKDIQNHLIYISVPKLHKICTKGDLFKHLLRNVLKKDIILLYHFKILIKRCFITLLNIVFYYPQKTLEPNKYLVEFGCVYFQFMSTIAQSVTGTLRANSKLQATGELQGNTFDSLSNV